MEMVHIADLVWRTELVYYRKESLNGEGGKQ